VTDLLGADELEVNEALLAALERLIARGLEGLGKCLGAAPSGIVVAATSGNDSSANP
jgi:hypothetical protein